MKIKDELLTKDCLIVECDNYNQRRELFDWLDKNTVMSYSARNMYSNNEGFTCTEDKYVIIHLNAKKMLDAIYEETYFINVDSDDSIIKNYKEIWEYDKEDLIAERMQTIAGMLDIPMDTDIILTKNGSKLIYTPHQLTNEGLFNCIGERVNDTLGNLLLGRYKIEKPPFQDRIKEGGVINMKFEDYYTVVNQEVDNYLRGLGFFDIKHPLKQIRKITKYYEEGAQKELDISFIDYGENFSCLVIDKSISDTIKIGSGDIKFEMFTTSIRNNYRIGSITLNKKIYIENFKEIIDSLVGNVKNHTNSIHKKYEVCVILEDEYFKLEVAESTNKNTTKESD